MPWDGNTICLCCSVCGRMAYRPLNCINTLMFSSQILKHEVVYHCNSLKESLPGGLTKFLCLVVLLNPLLEGFIPTARIVTWVISFNAINESNGETKIAAELFPISSQWATLNDHNIPVILLYKGTIRNSLMIIVTAIADCAGLNRGVTYQTWYCQSRRDLLLNVACQLWFDADYRLTK